MKEQNCDINKLYQGASTDFNEVDYLSNVVRLRAEFRKILSKKDAIDLADEGKHVYITGSEYHEPNGFPDQTNRIGKNGAITVEFEHGVPSKFYTPYGMIPVHDCANANQKNLFHKLEKEYGLVQVGGSQKNPIYAITKMPEIKKSILPWKRNQQAVPAKNLPMPLESYQTNRPEADQNIDYDLAKNPEYYQEHYKNSQYMAPEFVREKEHLQKVFDVVNTKCIQENHPEYIVPQTGNQPRINGIRYNLKYYLKKVPNALEQFKAALKEDNAKNAVMAAALKEEHNDREYLSHVIQEPTTTIANDLGREM